MSVSKIVEKTESEVQWANVTVNDLTVFGDLTIGGNLSTPACRLQIPTQVVPYNASGASFIINSYTGSVPLTFLNDPSSVFDFTDLGSGRVIFNKVGQYKIKLCFGNLIIGNGVGNYIAPNNFENYQVRTNLNQLINDVNVQYFTSTTSDPLFSTISFATVPPVTLVNPGYFSMVHEFTFDITSQITNSFKPYVQFLVYNPFNADLNISTVTQIGVVGMTNYLEIIKL